MMNNSKILDVTACQVALEFGFDKRIILQCFEDNISAGELVLKILELEESGISVDKKTEDQNTIDNEENPLLHETIKLWKRAACHMC